MSEPCEHGCDECLTIPCIGLTPADFRFVDAEGNELRVVKLLSVEPTEWP